MAKDKAGEEKKAEKKTKKKEAKEKEAKPKAKAKGKAKAEPEQLEEEEVESTGPGRLETAGLEEQAPADKAKEAAEKEAEELKEEELEKATEEEPKEKAKREEVSEEEEELEIVEEKFYDLNLRKIWSAPREKRTPRAVRMLREYISRRMKTDDVAISEAANSMLWARGISKPPRKIRVRAVKDKEGRVIVFPGEGK